MSETPDSKLAMIHSDRQSGFDRYLCDIPDRVGS